jgi:hypothetical protein
MNRFLINLRSLDGSGISSSAAQHFSQYSVPNFRVPDSILGNIGQPLNYGIVHDNADDNIDFTINDTAETIREESTLPGAIPQMGQGSPIAGLLGA